MKIKSKIIFAVLSLAMVLCAFILSGCQPGSSQPNLEPPAPVYKVHSVTIKMDGNTVEGTITTDLNVKTLQLTATVKKWRSDPILGKQNSYLKQFQLSTCSICSENVDISLNV